MLRLLVALDFSDCSRDAMRAAITVVDHIAPSELVVMTALEEVPEEEAQSERALSEMERATSALHEMVESVVHERLGAKLPKGAQVHYTAVRGAPAEQIIEQASVHHVDAIVMGTHGRTGLNRLIAGSVAEKVVRSAPCSVLTVKPKRTA